MGGLDYATGARGLVRFGRRLATDSALRQAGERVRWQMSK